MRDGVVAEAQLADAVGVAVEREDAARVERAPRQLVVDVLAVPVAVELDRDAARLAASSNTRVPVGRDSRAGC